MEIAARPVEIVDVFAVIGKGDNAESDIALKEGLSSLASLRQARIVVSKSEYNCFKVFCN